jgi:hypothetical protein
MAFVGTVRLTADPNGHVIFAFNMRVILPVQHRQQQTFVTKSL